MISGKYSIVLPLCALVTLALATFINSTSLHDSELVHQQEASEKSDQDNINEALDALINSKFFAVQLVSVDIAKLTKMTFPHQTCRRKSQ